MIKKILKLIGSGNRSLAEISGELNISTDSLKERLEMLARMGYLSRIDSCSPQKKMECSESSGESDNSEDTEIYECKHCILAKSCHDESKKQKILVGYVLTQKARSYIEQISEEHG